jgi:hypothetical protein
MFLSQLQGHFPTHRMINFRTGIVSSVLLVKWLQNIMYNFADMNFTTYTSTLNVHGLIQNFPDWCHHLHSSCGSAKHR